MRGYHCCNTPRRTEMRVAGAQGASRAGLARGGVCHAERAEALLAPGPAVLRSLILLVLMLRLAHDSVHIHSQEITAA
jgi:hypothetical protein